MLIYKKVSICFNIQFFMDKMKKVEKKNCKKIDPLPLGFEPQIFEQNFTTQDLNFEGD
jgi:hypothetical protein